MQADHTTTRRFTRLPSGSDSPSSTFSSGRRMLSALDSRQIIQQHDKALLEPTTVRRHESDTFDGLALAIGANHRMNTLLWKEEDLARRTSVSATAIVANKRAIDGFNQQRNDFIEQIDSIVLQTLADVVHESDARLHSETPGAMIDRLSILALKIHHMNLQTQRDDADAEHRSLAIERTARLSEQRNDLADCLDYAMTEGHCGRLFFKVYRQYKMYNDPAFNPHLSATHDN